MAKKSITLHPSVKECLGYHADDDDNYVLEDWNHRSTQVCKPCWELKYCPYGPFVEQSPLLPSLREEGRAHIERLKGLLESGVIGDVTPLSDERRTDYEEMLQISEEEPKLHALLVAREFYREKRLAQADEEGKDLRVVIGSPCGPIAHYRVPAPLDFSKPEAEEVELPEIEITEELQAAIDADIARIKKTLESGEEDTRRPLDEARRKSFAQQVEEFDPDSQPEAIPEVISRMGCNVFGHICPVVFVGESITETTELRRSGRYIPFTIKVRVVRRDNYTCQECGKHLKDDEVEFDHIIPVAKGGSSEEHNIRLTCFDCNRSKSDKTESVYKSSQRADVSVPL